MIQHYTGNRPKIVRTIGGRPVFKRKDLRFHRRAEAKVLFSRRKSVCAPRAGSTIFRSGRKPAIDMDGSRSFIRQRLAELKKLQPPSFSGLPSSPGSSVSYCSAALRNASTYRSIVAGRKCFNHGIE